MTNDTKALVERLHHLAEYLYDGNEAEVQLAMSANAMSEAADAIERLERELALAHDIERSDGEIRRGLDAKLAKLERDRDTLAAENAQLREALRDLFALIEDGTLVRSIVDDGREDWTRRMMHLVRTLKAAQDLTAPKP